MRILTAVLTSAALIAAPAVAAADSPHVRPLPQAHAHNDYEHDRPLLDALDHGFTSVEADIYLVGGQLLVAHDPQDLRPERTLQALYLEPLRDRVGPNGKVHQRGRGEFQLLIDIKNTGEQTYAALDAVLKSDRYAHLFTGYADGVVRRGAVTAVISGDRPRATMAAQTHRLAFYDGRIVNAADLGTSAAFAPLVSDNWTKLFTWRGVGEFPAVERARLHELVAKAHSTGQRVRFWATPDAAGPARDALWTELRAAGVDHVNTDDLAGLAEFLRR